MTIETVGRPLSAFIGLRTNVILSSTPIAATPRWQWKLTDVW